MVPPPRRNRGCLGFLVALGLAVAPVALASAGALGSVAAAQTPEQPPPEDAHIIYLRDCSVCHGTRGEGTNQGPRIAGVGPALVDYELSTGRMPIAVGEKVERRPPRYDAATRAGLV